MHLSSRVTVLLTSWLVVSITILFSARSVSAQDDGPLPEPAEVVIPTDDGGGSGDRANDDDDAGPTAAYVFSTTAEEELRPIVRELDSALRDVLAGDSHYSMANADRQMHGMSDDVVEALSQARDLFEAGRTAYDELDLEGAVEHFEQAIQLYEENVAHVTEYNPISECLLFIGASQILNGSTRQARGTFQRLLLIDPERRPDPDVFPPPVIEAFDYATARLERIRNGRFTVTSDPPGADVYVDGIFQGPAPQELSNFKAGRHYVRVRLQGYVEAGRAVELSVRSRRPTTVDFTLEPTSDGPVVEEFLSGIATQSAEDSDELSSSVRELGQMLSLGVLFLATIETGDDGIYVNLDAWNIDENRSVASERVGPFENDPVLIAGDSTNSAAELMLETWNIMNVPQVEDVPMVEQYTEPEPEPEPRGPIYRQWWFWTIIGAAVVGAGVGIGFGVAAATEEPGRTNGEVILNL